MRLWLHLVNAHGYGLGRIRPSRHHQDCRHEAKAEHHRSATKGGDVAYDANETGRQNPRCGDGAVHLLKLHERHCTSYASVTLFATAHARHVEAVLIGQRGSPRSATLRSGHASTSTHLGLWPSTSTSRGYGLRRAHAWACVRWCRVMTMAAVAGDLGLTLLMVLALPAGILLVGASVALFVRLVIEIAAAS